MFRLTGDGFVTIELVHDPARGAVDLGTGLSISSSSYGASHCGTPVFRHTESAGPPGQPVPSLSVSTGFPGGMHPSGSIWAPLPGRIAWPGRHGLKVDLLGF